MVAFAESFDIRDHEGLAVWHARRSRRAYADVPMEDLVQCAMIGAWMASRTFDESAGVRFSTYAVVAMRRETRKFARDHRCWLGEPYDYVLNPGKYSDPRAERDPVASAFLSPGRDLARRDDHAAGEAVCRREAGPAERAADRIDFESIPWGVLDRRERSLVRGYYLAGKDDTEIAREAGIARSTATQNRKIGIEKLRRAMGCD